MAPSDWKVPHIVCFKLLEELTITNPPPAGKIMYTMPMMFPLDSHGKIYVLQDEKGKTIGTGSRQVCRDLLHIITKPIADAASTGIEASLCDEINRSSTSQALA
jgi:hypothetical protein